MKNAQPTRNENCVLKAPLNKTIYCSIENAKYFCCLDMIY